MKAITYSRYGAPDVLKISEVKTPIPKDNEILIRVRAAEATKADCEMRSFRFAVKWFWLPLRIALGVTRPRREILGGYFAGEIYAVGKNVTRFSTGDQVFGSAGMKMGAYGEFVALPEHSTIAAKPDNMTFAEAAAVPLGGLNAIHFMRLASIQQGESVLINGAGGSIGAHAVQIARAMGAEVTGVDSPIKQDFLKRLGVEHFIDYTREQFTDTGKKYDVIFDMVPGSSYQTCIDTLNTGGRYLSGNPRFTVMLRCPLTTWFTDKTARFAFAKESVQELIDLKEMIENDALKPIVDKIYPMENAAAAHTRVEAEQRLGAVILKLG